MAQAGWKRAPPRTFYKYQKTGGSTRGIVGVWKTLTQATLPGTDQACFQTAETERTPTTCANGHVPLWEYEWRSLPIEAKSSSVRGHETVTGKDARDNTTKRVDSGKRITTNTNGACAFTETVKR